MGEYAQVLAETDELRAAMAALPASSARDETSRPVERPRDHPGHRAFSALAMGDWQRCLELNAEIVASERRRGSRGSMRSPSAVQRRGAADPAGAAGGGGAAAGECQRVFEDHADSRMLGHVLSLRADLEGQLNHYQAAGDLAKAALRLAYVRPEACDDRTGALQPRHLSPGDTERRSRRALSPTRGGPGLPDNRHGLRDGQCAARDRPDAT